MSDFTDRYKELVILQYYNSPKAQAEINLYAEEFENTFDFLNDFVNQFDIDKAYGDRLDLIGKIVGVSRVLENGIARYFFGFQGATNALGYGQGRWRGDNDSSFTPTELTDGEYRFVIKAKILKNTFSACIESNEYRRGMQETVALMFSNKAYVVDNLDMTMTLNIDDDYPNNDVDLLNNNGLIPRPQGVKIIINYITPPT